MLDLLIPLLMFFISVVALAKKREVYSSLLQGGLKLLLSIAPALVVLLTAVYMLRASGAVGILTKWLTPVAKPLGIPPETLPLVLLRPFSGSAALAIGADLMREYGVNSLIGRTAAIMLGSTETTFYTISVYFGAADIRKTRYAVPAALMADLTGFVFASLSARFLMPPG